MVLGKLLLGSTRTAADAADAVAAKIRLYRRWSATIRKIIVLASAPRFAAPIFERLRGHNIPTKSYYAEAELDTLEAQERFALLKLLLNNEDRVALSSWLLGRGNESWRAAQYSRITKRVRDDGTSPWITLQRLAAGQIMIPRTGTLVTRFNELREDLTALGETRRCG